jgi:CRISPR-associated protein Csd2
MERLNYIFPADILEKYEIYNYAHAAEIMSLAYPNEFNDLVYVLRNMHITLEDILTAGGNESPIPPKYKEILFPRGWSETRIHGDLNLVMDYRSSAIESKSILLPNYINGYNIDFFKNKIAIDTEWNSKDQTFDRDLMAMRTYYEFGIISSGVIITRGTELKSLPKELDPTKKFGASSTWMGKLLYRLESRRSGGCPIIAIGITPECIEGLVLN